MSPSRTGPLTLHTRTAMHYASEVCNVRWEVKEEEEERGGSILVDGNKVTRKNFIVRCCGAGLSSVV